jgi:hypothetical protein
LAVLARESAAMAFDAERHLASVSAVATVATVADHQRGPLHQGIVIGERDGVSVRRTGEPFRVDDAAVGGDNVHRQLPECVQSALEHFGTCRVTMTPMPSPTGIATSRFILPKLPETNVRVVVCSISTVKTPTGWLRIGDRRGSTWTARGTRTTASVRVLSRTPTET